MISSTWIEDPGLPTIDADRLNDREFPDCAMAPNEDVLGSLRILTGIEVGGELTESIFKALLELCWSFGERLLLFGGRPCNFQQFFYVCHGFLQCSQTKIGFPFCLSLLELDLTLKVVESIDGTEMMFVALIRSSSKKSFKHTSIKKQIGLWPNIWPRTKSNLDFKPARKSYTQSTSFIMEYWTPSQGHSQVISMHRSFPTGLEKFVGLVGMNEWWLWWAEVGITASEGYVIDRRPAGEKWVAGEGQVINRKGNLLEWGLVVGGTRLIVDRNNAQDTHQRPLEWRWQQFR